MAKFTVEQRNKDHWDFHTEDGRIALRGGPTDGRLNYWVRDERDTSSAIFDGEFPDESTALSVIMVTIANEHRGKC